MMDVAALAEEMQTKQSRQGGGYWVMTREKLAEVTGWEHRWDFMSAFMRDGELLLFGQAVKAVHSWGQPFEFIARCPHCECVADYAALCSHCGAPMPGWGE